MLQKGSHYAFAATVVDVGDWLVQARVTKEGDVDGRLHFPVGSAVAKVTGNLGIQIRPLHDVLLFLLHLASFLLSLLAWPIIVSYA